MTTPTNPQAATLLPCPFCGSAANHYPDGDEEGYSIMCSGEGGLEFKGDATRCPMTTFGYASALEAEQAWNRRTAPPAAVPEGREALPVAVLELNRLWNAGSDEATIAGQLDLCRRLATQQPTAHKGAVAESDEQDAARFRALVKNTGREFVLATPGKPHLIQIRLDARGCERHLPDGAADFPATIRAILDDEIRLQNGSGK